MSECLSPYQISKFEHSVKTSPHSPHLSRTASTDPHLSLSLSFNSLFVREVQRTKLEFKNFTYVDILNSQLPSYQLVQTDRIEKRFYNICREVSSQFKRLAGRKLQIYYSTVITMAVFDYELLNIRDMHFKLSKFEKENILLEQKCIDLMKLLTVERERSKIEENTQIQIDKLRDKNIELFNYIKILEKRQVSRSKNSDFDSLSRVERKKTVKELHTKAEKALWFAECYGLIPDSVRFKSSKFNEAIKIDLAQTPPQLDVTDKQKMKKLLYIMDRFCISDATYHELAMFSDEMPRQYLICQYRNELNKTFHIERTPGNIPGAYMSLQKDLSNFLEKLTMPVANKIQIKISGDGSKVSRISNFVVLSYSLVTPASTVSVDEQRVFAIVNCTENYENMKSACMPIFDEINRLNEIGTVCVNGNDIEIELLFGGDMKFVQIMLGLTNCMGHYSCPWCKIHKENRNDFDQNWDYYHSDEIARNILELKMNSTKNVFGSKFKPLINIEPHRIIPDELHLLLRISDILLRNLIDDTKSLDDKNKVRGLKSDHLGELVSKIRECGVSFNIWTPKGSKEIEWTSLTGSEYKHLLEKLPEKLFFVVHHDTHDSTTKLWREFACLYKYVSHEVLDFTLKPEHLFEKCRAWAELFLSLGCNRTGYNNITPYIHVLVYHIPWFVKTYGKLSKFSGQGVEKINDQVKMIHQKKTNKIDATVDALKVRKRIEFLQAENCDRKVRKYEKKKDCYWGEDIFLQRSAKKARILTAIENANVHETVNQPSYRDMSLQELKALLKDRGIKSKTKKKERMIELLETRDK